MEENVTTEVQFHVKTIGSMGLVSYTYIYHEHQVNVNTNIQSSHGSYGLGKTCLE